MATALAPELKGEANAMIGPEAADRLDVTQPHLYTSHTWHAPFRELRENGGIYYCENGRFGPYWSISTYKPIVHIEALPKVFSSSWEVGGITVAVDQMLVVLEFHVADVQKPIAAHTEIDESGLDTGLDVDDPALVDVSDVVLETVTFDVQFLKDPILHDGNPTFLRLEDVDQHFLLHCSPLIAGECEDHRRIAGQMSTEGRANRFEAGLSAQGKNSRIAPCSPPIRQ